MAGECSEGSRRISEVLGDSGSPLSASLLENRCTKCGRPGYHEGRSIVSLPAWGEKQKSKIATQPLERPRIWLLGSLYGALAVLALLLPPPISDPPHAEELQYDAKAGHADHWSSDSGSRSFVSWRSGTCVLR